MTDENSWVIRHQRLDFVPIHLVRSKSHASDGIQQCDYGIDFLFPYALKPLGLFPTQEMKGKLALNRHEVRMIRRDNTGTDTPCREGDQHVKSEIAQLGGLIVLSPSEPIEDLRGLQPLLLRWSQHLAPSAQFKDKLPFSGCSSPAEQFVEYN